MNFHLKPKLMKVPVCIHVQSLFCFYLKDMPSPVIPPPKGGPPESNVNFGTLLVISESKGPPKSYAPSPLKVRTAPKQ